MVGMPNKTVAAQRSGRTTTKKSPDAVEILVRRGALRRFDALKGRTSELPVVVSWDRRKGDRRTSSNEVSSNRRQTDRRQKPPFTWDLADFVVADPVRDRTPRSKTAKRSGKKTAKAS